MRPQRTHEEKLSLRDGVVHVREYFDGEFDRDGAALERREEGLDLVLRETLRCGGKARLVGTRPDLGPVGGIGAVLRL
jgi:hypothetical protein